MSAKAIIFSAQQKAAAGRLSAPSCSLQFLIIFVRSTPRCDIPAKRRRHR